MDLLNSKDKAERLSELRRLVKTGEKAAAGEWVNNHIHTFYSFSPYSPSKAIWLAYLSGLTTAGIMDHDSVSGAKEFIEAGEIVGIATTNGVECRADFSGTAIEKRRINNPDQDGVAYIALHSIPHRNIDRVDEFLKPYREARNRRNRAMTEKINSLVSGFGLTLDFDGDIVPLSKSDEGGSITERHLLYALSLKITEKLGKGEGVLRLLSDLGIKVEGKACDYLKDSENPYYEYDLLGVLKGNMVEKFYINATDECPKIEKLIAFSKEIGAISAYAYLGDVGDSVTGDKKSQTFEDSYLELLFDELKRLDFDAVTYMPSRNTAAQIDRVRSLCDKHGFMQISGEDINSPRQSFICPRLSEPEFKNLVESTWYLIKHERM
ncbi:MAG: hypothetical protein BWY15_01888 [Firmicutes bacterium ADurb.Bin193]|nr:MAG: hypothetical protein BWY15_01888 [Firmicutes bacterium ADurb.Bin193]